MTVGHPPSGSQGSATRSPAQPGAPQAVQEPPCEVAQRDLIQAFDAGLEDGFGRWFRENPVTDEDRAEARGYANDLAQRISDRHWEETVGAQVEAERLRPEREQEAEVRRQAEELEAVAEERRRDRAFFDQLLQQNFPNRPWPAAFPEDAVPPRDHEPEPPRIWAQPKAAPKAKAAPAPAVNPNPVQALVFPVVLTGNVGRNPPAVGVQQALAQHVRDTNPPVVAGGEKFFVGYSPQHAKRLYYGLWNNVKLAAGDASFKARGFPPSRQGELEARCWAHSFGDLAVATGLVQYC